MPTYKYYCTKCETHFLINHSINEECNKCASCSDERIFKVPSNITFTNKQNIGSDNKKAGDVVKESINDIKNDVAEQKSGLKNRVWPIPGNK